MKTYEIILHFSPNLQLAQALPEELATVNRMIQKNGGTVIQQDDWGVKRLSYPIKQHEDAHTVLLKATLPEESVAPLASALRLVPGLLRHRVLTYVAVSKPVAPVTVIPPTAAPECVSSAPTAAQSPEPAPTPMNEEELDKTIEKILEDKIV